MARTNSPFDTVKPDADYARPRLKSGVRRAADAPPRGLARGAREPALALRNPETGRSIRLSGPEAALLEQADGSRDLAALHACQPEEGALDPEGVMAFFRRLSIMGFLASEAERESPEPPARPLRERGAALRGRAPRAGAGARAARTGSGGTTSGAGAAEAGGSGPSEAAGTGSRPARLETAKAKAQKTMEARRRHQAQKQAEEEAASGAKPAEDDQRAEVPSAERGTSGETAPVTDAASEAKEPAQAKKGSEGAVKAAKTGDGKTAQNAGVTSLDEAPRPTPDETSAASETSDSTPAKPPRGRGGARLRAVPTSPRQEKTEGTGREAAAQQASAETMRSASPVAPVAGTEESEAPAERPQGSGRNRTSGAAKNTGGPSRGAGSARGAGARGTGIDGPRASGVGPRQTIIDGSKATGAEARGTDGPKATGTAQEAPALDPLATVTATLRPASAAEAAEDIEADVDALTAELANDFGMDFVGRPGEGAGGEPAGSRMGGEGQRLRALLAARQGQGGMGGGFGGGMGAGLGGMGAGMGGGFGGGMGARGGLGAGMGGMGGGLGAMGGLGAGMGAGMGGGFGGMGGMAAQQPGPEEGPARLPLFNPQALLKLLYIAFYPAKFLFWALVPLVLIAGMTIFQNWEPLIADIYAALGQVSRLWVLIGAAGIVNLVSRLAQGVAIVAHGGRVSRLGVTLMLGILPRFYVDTSAVRMLDRRGQLWAHGAPLLARLATFGFGMLFWAVTRDSGTWFADMSLIAAKIGLIVFVLSALPLIPAEGQRWMAVYFNDPRLMPKTLAALRHVFFRRPLPPFVGRADLGPLIFFGLATVITSVAGLTALAIYAAIALERELGGMGVSIFFGLVLAFVIWLLAVKATLGRRMAQMSPQMAAMAAETGPRPHPLEATTGAQASGAAKVVWALIGAGLLAVAFLPYTYEAGGQVEILPASRAKAIARTEGEVIELFVTKGELVAPGQPLAQLSNWEQLSQRDVTATELAAAEAKLQRLRAGAKPEEVRVAETRLDSARAALAFSEAELARSEDLAAKGTISGKDLEKARAAHQNDLSALASAEANLALVESGATAEELAIAEADVQRLRIQLAFHEAEVTRTRVEAPMAGRVITSDLELQIGSFLRVGDPLLEIERTERISAAIDVPEFDITLIAPGDAVRMKVRGYQEDEIEGRVAAIAPTAEDKGYGRVVRVDAVFENPDDFLRSGTTGYAKIEGTEMRVWEAYLRSIQRFFQIEFWSWIP
ncbi:HlyD family secretion protein [Roseivivax sp. GX 12232]|uniref:HlyD family secretion protein n=1 Tax=Roseivivax sp. GX 12232 TaxID=2900547 RepID=UPI0021085363|nr:efflux RND transporter periplasmic adaptor subunit [Roseivivax sp. GX 12232]